MDQENIFVLIAKLIKQWKKEKTCHLIDEIT